MVSRRDLFAIGGGALAISMLAKAGNVQAKPPKRSATLTPTRFDYAAGNVDMFTVNGPSGPHTVYVGKPTVGPPKDGYPVLWMLDGEAYFGTAIDCLRLQAEWPAVSGVHPMMIVAVGYPGRRFFNMERRCLDFLPPATSNSLAVRQSLFDPYDRSEPRKYLSAGGADPFAHWLATDLRAAIAARYPINPAKHCLTGHSLGGAFCAYALANHPGAFRRFAPLSPSLWWDEGRIVRDLEALDPSRLAPDFQALIALADTEIPESPDVNAMMLRDSRTAYAALAAKPGLADRTRLVELKGESHQSSHMVMMSAILRLAST